MLQSLLVVALAAAAGGFGAIGIGLTGVVGWIAGAAIVVGAWLVWITFVTVIGTLPLREPQTLSSFSELVRTLGFAMAPAVFLVFCALRAAAPIVFAIVLVWVVAATVLAMRQALDYRSTTRAVVVCVIGWFLAVDLIAVIAVIFTRTVS
jgi:hypothetical protein